MIFNRIKELKAQGLRIGITFSQFDLLHAGHVAMLVKLRIIAITSFADYKTMLVGIALKRMHPFKVL